jgi:hypothetical protein
MQYHSRLCITILQMAECYQLLVRRKLPLIRSPSLEIHTMGTESSGQAYNLFNIWTIWAMDRTSAQPQVKLSLLRSKFWNSSHCARHLLLNEKVKSSNHQRRHWGCTVLIVVYFMYYCWPLAWRDRRGLGSRCRSPLGGHAAHVQMHKLRPWFNVFVSISNFYKRLK